MKRVLFSIALLTVAGQMQAGCCYAQPKRSTPVVEETKNKCGGCDCQDEVNKNSSVCQDGCDCDDADVRCDSCGSEESYCGDDAECTDCTNCDSCSEEGAVE